MRANSTLNTAVGGRFFPMRVTQGAAFPCVQYQVISTTPVNQKSGAAKADFARVQINCFASDYKSASGVADKVRASLEAYSGTVNTIKVQYIEYMGASETIDDNASYNGIYNIQMDFMMYYANG